MYANYECLLYQYHTYVNKSSRHFFQIRDILILTNLIHKGVSCETKRPLQFAVYFQLVIFFIK